jgi:hypothetical protein
VAATFGWTLVRGNTRLIDRAGWCRAAPGHLGKRSLRTGSCVLVAKRGKTPGRANRASAAVSETAAATKSATFEPPPEEGADCANRLKGTTAKRPCSGRSAVRGAGVCSRLCLRACTRLTATLCRRDERLGRTGKGGRVDAVLTCVRGGSCAAAGVTRAAGFDGTVRVGVAGAGFDTGGAGSGFGSGSAGSVTLGGSEPGGWGSSARALEGKSATASNDAAHATVFVGTSTRDNLGRAHLGGLLMAGPSADFSHGYARASAQSQQLAIWLGFAAHGSFRRPSPSLEVSRKTCNDPPRRIDRVEIRTAGRRR